MSDTETASAPTPKAKPQKSFLPIRVSLGNLLIDEKFNVRRVYDDQSIKELAADMKQRGQLSPVIVSPYPKGGSAKPYKLIVGFRRSRAAALLNWEDISAEVFDGDEAAQMCANVAENVVRENLQPWEIAVKLVDIRDKFKLSGEKMGRLVGISKSYANNLMRCEDHLIPVARESFHSPANPGVQWLQSLAAMPPDEQAVEWDRKMGTKQGEGSGSGAPVASKRPSVAKLSAALEALLDRVKEGKIERENAKLAVSCLKWAAGVQATIPGVYDPRKPVEEEAAE